MSLSDDNMIKEKSEELMNSNKMKDKLKDDKLDTKQASTNKLNLNSILNLKDKQLEKNGKSSLNKPLNVTRIDRQPNKEKFSRLKKMDDDQIEQLTKLNTKEDSTKEDSSSQLNKTATGKKSKIPTLKDKYLKRSKSLTLHKNGLFARNRLSNEDKVDKDLEKMFNLKFKK